MIQIETLQEELIRIGEEISPVSVAGFHGFTYERVTPAHHFVTVDLHVPNMGFVHVTARDSYTKSAFDLLSAAFAQVRSKKCSKDVLHVYKIQVGNFDCIGLAPPKLAKLYEFQSAVLSRHGYELFPMYGIEFLDGFSADQFWTQRKRHDRWQVSILDWSRRIYKNEEA